MVLVEGRLASKSVTSSWTTKSVQSTTMTQSSWDHWFWPRKLTCWHCRATGPAEVEVFLHPKNITSNTYHLRRYDWMSHPEVETVKKYHQLDLHCHQDSCRLSREFLYTVHLVCATVNWLGGRSTWYDLIPRRCLRSLASLGWWSAQWVKGCYRPTVSWPKIMAS